MKEEFPRKCAGWQVSPVVDSGAAGSSWLLSSDAAALSSLGMHKVIPQCENKTEIFSQNHNI